MFKTGKKRKSLIWSQCHETEKSKANEVRSRLRSLELRVLVHLTCCHWEELLTWLSNLSDRKLENVWLIYIYRYLLRSSTTQRNFITKSKRKNESSMNGDLVLLSTGWPVSSSCGTFDGDFRGWPRPRVCIKRGVRISFQSVSYVFSYSYGYILKSLKRGLIKK